MKRANEIRFSHQDEWKNILEQTCTPRAHGEPPQVGDVTSIQREKQDGPSMVHGYVYLNQGLGFGTRGKDFRFTPNLQSMKQILLDYDGKIRPECINPTSESRKNCKYTLQYFKCELPFKQDQELEVRAFEQKMSALTCVTARADTAIQELADSYEKIADKIPGYLRAAYRAQMTFLEEAHQHPLVLAIRRGRLADIVDLLEKTDPNLHPFLPDSVHRPSTVRRLIEAGANLEQKRGDGTALFWALALGRESSAEMLINAGADIETKIGRFPPLHLAVRYARLDNVKQLIEKGMNEKEGYLEALDDWGFTPLDNAVHFNHPNLVKYLLKRGAKLESSDPTHPRSAPALNRAAEKGNLKMVRLLIQAGATILAKDPSGRDAIDAATRAHYPEVAEYLKEQSKIQTSEQLDQK